MKHTDDDDDLVTIPLSELLTILLGDQTNSTLIKYPLPPKTAMVLNHKLGNSFVYKIANDPDTGEPYIWWYREWYDDTDRRRRQKAYSEHLRVQGWLQTANVKMVAKAIQRAAKIPDDVARAMAYTIIKKPNAIIALKEIWGVEKLKTKEEEL